MTTSSRPFIDRRLTLANATAKSNSIANRKLTDLNPRISSQCFVKFQHKVSVIPNIFPKRCIRWCHQRSIPKGVVIANHSTNLNKIN
ncbi:hypothetical protein Hanom_Chr15g01374801 [Helianthus anomalus]